MVTSGPGISVQDTAEQQTVLVLATQQHVDVSFVQADLLLSLDDFSERILLPMMNNLAGSVAQTIMSNTEGAICNIQGNLDGAGNIQTPNAGTYLQAGARLADNSAPVPARKVINDPWTQARVVQSLSGLLNPNTAISEQYYEGVMYRALGLTWYMDQTVIKHTAGTFTAGTVNGANQTGPTLTTNAITGTLVAGDIITLAGVNAVNRVTKQTTGMVRQFVVTANVATNGTSIGIYPSLIPPVRRQYRAVSDRHGVSGGQCGDLALYARLGGVPAQLRLRAADDHHGNRRSSHPRQSATVRAASL